MEQLRFTPFLFGSRLENVKTFVEELKQLLRWQNQEQTSENVWSDEDRQTNSIKQELHKEWIKVIDELGLKERKTGPMSGSFYMRLYETTPMYFNFDGITAKMIKDKISSILVNPSLVKDNFCGKFPMNFQRTMDLAPSEFLVSTL
jgi:hypothetical protein